MIRLPISSVRTLMAVAWLAAAAPAAFGADNGPVPALTLPARAPAASVSLEKLRGQVVMVNFWASWCGPCREEFPLLDQMYKRYKGAGFTMLGVNVEPDSSDAESFLAKTPISFPIAYDRDSVASRLFHVDAMPSTVLIDRHGVVRWSHRGYRAGDENEYLDQIRALLREK
jgi:thiol-disulfide isomerase/thioredoxin